MAKIPYRTTGPCTDCPWRMDVEPGQFETHRFEELRNTSVQPEVRSVQDLMEQPMFACHQTPEGREQACAGWLVVAATRGNLRIRVALALRELPEEAVIAGEHWPPLFSSYEEMAARQGRADDGLGDLKQLRKGA